MQVILSWIITYKWRQSYIFAALQFIHSKQLCHLDVKLDNILVFSSDFSLVKLCDFGAVKSVGDIVIKKNELLPYCPAELVHKHANEYYQVDKVQDVFQFGIVIFFCQSEILLGLLLLLYSLHYILATVTSISSDGENEGMYIFINPGTQLDEY